MNGETKPLSYEGDGRKVAYLSGAITLNPQRHKQDFARAERYVEDLGYIVLNPAVLPQGMAHGKYLPINDAMIRVSDTVFLLPNWAESVGCAHEIRTAKSLGREVKEVPLSVFESDGD